MRHLNFGAFISIIFAVAYTGFAGAATLVRSEMKNWRWDQSTILAGFIHPTLDRSQLLALYSASPTRATYARVWLSERKVSKGLYLILPGTGSNADSPAGGAIAEQIAKNGFDAIVLPSPFSEEFQRTFSSDGAIGIPQRDLPRVLEMLESAIQEFQVYYHRPREVSLIGYSLGGMYAALIEASRMSAGFHRIIALSPPLSFRHAILAIDDLIRLSQQRHMSVLRTMRELFHVMGETREGITLADMKSIKEWIGTDEFLNRQIIGKSFQISLKEIVERESAFVTTVSTSTDISFSRYMAWLDERLIRRTRLKAYGLAQLLADLDFDHFEKTIRSDERFYLITATDDFLNSAQMLRAADQTLGGRLIVFDKGGHCGYLWTPSFHHVLQKIL